MSKKCQGIIFEPEDWSKKKEQKKREEIIVNVWRNCEGRIKVIEQLWKENLENMRRRFLRSVEEVL